MADQFSAAPINPLISVTPLSVAAPGRDASDVPPALANLPGGTTVEGFVINRDGQNNPILRTPVGDVLIKSDIFLKTGSEVVFRIDTTLATRARIVTIDNLSPSDYAAQQTRLPDGDIIEQPTLSTGPEPLPAGTASNAPAQPSAPPSSLLAVLLAPAGKPANIAGLPPETPIPTALAALQTGATLKITVLKLELPVSIVPPPLAPANQAAATPTHYLAQPVMSVPLPEEPLIAHSLPPLPGAPSQAALEQAPTPRPPIQPVVPSTRPVSLVVEQPPEQQPLAAAPFTPIALPQEEAQVKVAQTIAQDVAQLTSQQAASKAPPLPGQSIFTPGVNTGVSALPTRAVQVTPQGAPLPPDAMQATVIGHEKDGATVLQTPVGTLKAFIPQQLPTGTKLVVRMEPAPADSTMIVQNVLSDSMEGITSLARDWKSLGDVMQALQAMDPQIAKSFMQQLPNVSAANFSSSMLFFLAAVKGGDARQWFGNKLTDQIAEKLPELAGRLTEDMGQLQQAFTDSPNRNWSMVMLPMLFENQLEQARLFFRRDEEAPEKGGKDGTSHRFIVEVGLSHLGDLQFDGFVKKAERRQVFDLIIRSARPLAETVSNDIRGLFHQALEATGYRGYLTFQQGSQFFARPMAGLETSPESGGSSGGSQPILA